MVRPATLVHFYRRRLRVHALQELLAGGAIAVSVALVLTLQAAGGGVGAAARQNVRALSGDATLTLAAREERGFDARMRARVAALPGVARAAAVLEQGASVAYGARRVQIQMIGADARLSSLHPLATRRIDLGRLQPGLVLSAAVARRLALAGAGDPGGLPRVRLVVRGREQAVPVSAVLDHGMIGPLSGASIAFVSLTSAQRLAQLPGRASRILVAPAPGRQARVRAELARLAAGRLTVMSRGDELRSIARATDPIDDSTTVLTAVGGLVALLFVLIAMLPTLADRRRFVAALRATGCSWTSIAQLLAFQAFALGVCGSAAGVLVGVLLAPGADRDLTGYLGFAYLLGAQHALSWRALAGTFAGGVLASALATALPLLDLRAAGAPATAPARRRRSRRGLGPGQRLLAGRRRPSSLVLALRTLRASPRAALGVGAAVAVAVFAAVGLQGSHQGVLSGMDAGFRGYLGTADVWIAQPGDDLALHAFDARGLAPRIAAVDGVRGVQPLRSSLLDVGDRRVWVSARARGDRPLVPPSQVIAGDARTLAPRVQAGGWVAVSQQVAAAQHAAVGGELRLPTPAGSRTYRVAAITTNLGWGPGAVVMSARDYRRAWGGDDPSALEVDLAPGADADAAVLAIRRALGVRAGGLQVETAAARIARAAAVARSGPAWSSRAAWLLLVAAALAVVAAIGAGSWQRRAAFGQLRLMGWRSLKLWYAVLWETALVLGGGCLAGAGAGVYGQYLGDRWLRRGIGYPTAHVFVVGQAAASCLLVFALALAGTAVAGAFISRTPPHAGRTP
jgi:putative ABC transport system permease protein